MQVVFLLGAIHGIILSALLATKKVNRLSNRLLSVLMLIFSIDLGMAAVLGYGLHLEYPHISGIDYPITMLYGPLIYLYTKSLINNSKNINRRNSLHFIPFLLFVIYMLPFYSYTGSEKLLLMDSYGNLNYGWDIATHIKVAFNMSYIPFITLLFFNFRKKLKANFSTLEKRNLDWLKKFVFGGVLLALIAVVLHTMNIFADGNAYADFTLFSVTIFVYSIGYMGLRQPEFFTEFEPEIPQEITSAKNGKSYSRSGLNDEEGKALIKKLCDLMENEKLFRNSDIDLRELAGRAGISTHNLTEVINKHANRNFYDFINAYRCRGCDK